MGRAPCGLSGLRMAKEVQSHGPRAWDAEGFKFCTGQLLKAPPAAHLRGVVAEPGTKSAKTWVRSVVLGTQKWGLKWAKDDFLADACKSNDPRV